MTASLIMAAAHIARTVPPGQWEEFIKAFAEHTAIKTAECVNSPPDMLPATQGRAQACEQLRKLFTDCRTSADKISAKNNPQPRSPHPAVNAANWKV